MVINTNEQSIRNFGMSLQSSNDQLLSLRKTLNNAINDIEVIQMNKLDVHDFEKVRKSLEFKFETN